MRRSIAATQAPPLVHDQPLVGQRLHLRRLLMSLWVGLFLVHGLVYLALVPPWQAPDEPTSFELLLTMEARGRFVDLSDRDPAIQRAIIASMERTGYWERGGYGPRPTASQASFEFIYPCCYSQLNRPPLYQLLQLPVAQFTRGLPVEQRLLVARAATLLLGAATVAIAVAIGWELVGVHAAVPLVFPALLVFNPQFVYSSATFNSDNLVALLGAVLCLLLLHMLRRGISALRLALIVGVVALGFFTKRTTLFLLPTIGGAILWQLWRGRAQASVRPFVVVGAIAVVCAGGLLLPAVRTPLSAMAWRFGVAPQLGTHLKQIVGSVVDQSLPLSTRLGEATLFFTRTFWANYGWHRAFIPPPVVYALLGVSLLSSGLAVAIMVRRRTALPAWEQGYVWLCMFATVSGLLILFLYIRYPGLPQGRYAFPMLLPILLIIAVGICGWWPRRWLSPGLVITLLCLIALDVYSLFGILLPGFYA